MSEKPPRTAWKSKRRLSAQAARMRAAKRLKHQAMAAPDDEPQRPEAVSGSVVSSDVTETSGEARRMDDTSEGISEAVDTSGETTRATEASGETTRTTEASGETTRATEASGEASRATEASGEVSRATEARGVADTSEEVANLVTMGDESDNSDVEEGERVAQDVFDEWMLTLTRLQRNMLTVLLFESFRNRQQMSKMGAAQESASITGFNERTVRMYVKEFFDNNMSFLESQQGKYERLQVLGDEDLRKKASQWVRENAFKKGEPNITAAMFCEYVNTELLPNHHLPPNFPRTISLRTAIRWLHRLGFKPISHKKGVYSDGHEREDVVKHRKEFLEQVHQLQQNHQPPPPCGDEPSPSDPTSSALALPSIAPPEANDKKLLMIFHDESIFCTNERQTWMWGTDESPAILPKTKGSGIMVSDFIEEYNGYLRMTLEELVVARQSDPDFPSEARKLLEYGVEREGYWTNEKFMVQIRKAAQIAEHKFPPAMHTIIWLFDQSSCHKAYAPDALNAHKMNGKPGGAQPVMRDTVWGRRTQRMVDDNGVPKGMKQVLDERGINTATLIAKDMRAILSNHEDFRCEKTIVENYLIGRSHIVFMIPKFHCELNTIERVWGEAKRYSRKYTNFTLPGLRRILPLVLDSVGVTSIRKYFRNSRNYERAYREGQKAGKEVEQVVMKYKSHRRIFKE